MNLEVLIEGWFFKVVLTVLVSFIGVFLGLLYKGFDRKITAMMQSRIGPPWIQPFRDVKKLFMKETIIPDTAIPWLFNAAPIVALVAPLIALAYLPLGPFGPIMEGYGGLILLLYLLAIPAVAMAFGGLASGSPYATVGSQRELVLMMSYELPLAITAVALAFNYETFSIATISSEPVWNSVGMMGGIGFALILAALFAVMPGELSKVPFDQAEAETELAGGLFVEYSGRNLGIFYIAEVVKMVVVGAFLIALFFPYNLSSLYSFGGPEINGMMLWNVIVDTAFFLFKLLIIIYVAVSVIRVGFARFQINKASYFYWVPMTIISLLGMLLVVVGGAA
ncbi:MAG: NADH-quinone oxidoreductase subunit H [Candidatus Thermoplasmatota archaeon]|nr:NADH-quinone oxidoreductase subunit H [Candidatus Thermoplasmatota archaeon]MBS3789370.1 NADH-quinone oxidoreductase subunit H [Candidatus Thermoplasmatota archaeon]